MWATDDQLLASAASNFQAMAPWLLSVRSAWAQPRRAPQQTWSPAGCLATEGWTASQAARIELQHGDSRAAARSWHVPEPECKPGTRGLAAQAAAALHYTGDHPSLDPILEQAEDQDEIDSLINRE